MKTKTRVLGLFVAFGLTAGALGMMGSLTEPSLTFDKDFPEAARTNVLAILRKPDCKFVEGNWLNAWTSLQYDGDTWALNGMLERLGNCPGVTLGIVLEADRRAEQAAWTVGQNAHEPRKLSVYVNLNSPHIKIRDLRIPEIQGPALLDAKEK